MLKTIILLSAAVILLSGGIAAAAEDIGKVIAMRGSATIEREGTNLAAGINSGIQPNDIIRTSVGSRVKMKFVDDSVLTLVDNSKLVIREFLYSKEKGGKSIFNLLDGKMHSIVGKTKFEVRTPTAIAAARGTVIFFQVSSSRKD